MGIVLFYLMPFHTTSKVLNYKRNSGSNVAYNSPVGEPGIKHFAQYVVFVSTYVVLLSVLIK